MKVKKTRWFQIRKKRGYIEKKIQNRSKERRNSEDKEQIKEGHLKQDESRKQEEGREMGMGTERKGEL